MKQVIQSYKTGELSVVDEKLGVKKLGGQVLIFELFYGIWFYGQTLKDRVFRSSLSHYIKRR